MSMSSFRELVVWQKSLVLAELTYKLTSKLPNDERFALISQMQRSAVSIPSNLAEGAQRNNRAEFRHFCGIAYGSAAELETQLILCERIYELRDLPTTELLNETQRMLRQLIQKLAQLTTKI